jgi:8-oxo-dGTP pyrophosphatase MutT (NUDIX family)
VTAVADDLPGWWQPLLANLAAARPEDFSRLEVPAHGGRPSAVLILLGEDTAHEGGPGGPDVLILQRAPDMRTHAGQPAFPGGATDPGDDGPAGTALREAGEEVGLDPASVAVLATLPPLWIPVSGFVVTPVLAWWRRPHPVRPLDPAEVARVVRVPVAELTDPANRVRVQHPSGWVGPAFRVRQMLVWGFTGGVIDVLLRLAGWNRPWDEAGPPVPLPVSGDQPVP